MDLGRDHLPTHVGQIDVERWIAKIAKSRLSVPQYFDNRRVPFSRAQYYRYKKKMDREGVESLKDERTQGNSRRLTAEAEGYLKGYVLDSRTSLTLIYEANMTMFAGVDRISLCVFRSYE